MKLKLGGEMMSENIKTLTEDEFEKKVYEAGFVNYYLEDEKDKDSKVFDSTLNIEVAEYLGFKHILNDKTQRYLFTGDIRELSYPKDKTTTEWCPNCEHEIELENVFMVQICPSCGKKIKPCNLCIECKSTCPLG